MKQMTQSQTDLTLPLHTSAWRRAALLTVALLALLLALFWPTFSSMVEIWERSETFTHGFLIFPISLWLIWGRRHQVMSLQPVPDKRALFVLMLAGFGWLMADAGGVRVVEQLSLVTMLIAAVWAVLGWSVFTAMLFPLMFLYFAVPMGEFLIPHMMTFTADFTVSALQLVGIPVYREGTFFSIPSGDWSVVEGCSGLRYLIASFTLGCLYAYLTYRSWKRRLLFGVAALVVPVFANGCRAFMIVMIAHLSGMKLALGVDHLIYGWVFFGIVMLLLFWVGSFWREDDSDVHLDKTGKTYAVVESIVMKPLLGMSAAVIALLALWLAYGHWLNNRVLPEIAQIHVRWMNGWEPAEPFSDWHPHWLGATRVYEQNFARAGKTVLLRIDYYPTQKQDHELINSQNYMVVQKDKTWSNVGESLIDVKIDGKPRNFKQAKLRSPGQRILVWQWNDIDGRVVNNDYLGKLILAWDKVRGSRDDGSSVLIATPYSDNQNAAKATLAAFAADMRLPIQEALQAVAVK
ncbi:MAG: exosortase A [Thiobacillaceae bacterium]